MILSRKRAQTILGAILRLTERFREGRRVLARKAGEYKATVHTLEIQPIMSAKWAGKEYDWWKKVFERNFDFINDKCTIRGKNYKEIRLKINPHKLHKGESGLWVFDYRSADEIESDMEKICSLMEVEDYVIKRLDIAFDSKRSYTTNEKIIRLIQLMIDDRWKKHNRYTSIDPLTLEPKTTAMYNNVKYRSTLQTEHYNRAIFEQNEWENAPIVNRFEVRALRHMLKREKKKGDKEVEGLIEDDEEVEDDEEIEDNDWVEGDKTEGDKTEDMKKLAKVRVVDVARRWMKEFNKLGRKEFDDVVEQLTEAVYSQWTDYVKRSGAGAGSISNMRNNFYSVKSEYIFTRAQLVTLYEWDGEERKGQASNAVENLLKRKCRGNLFELFSWKEIQAEIDSLRDALAIFIGDSK